MSFLVAVSMVFGVYYLMDKHPDFIEEFDFTRYKDITTDKIKNINPFNNTSHSNRNINELLDRIVSSRDKSSQNKTNNNDIELKEMIQDLNKKIDNLNDKVTTEKNNLKTDTKTQDEDSTQKIFEVIGKSPIYKVDSFNSIAITFDVISGSKNPSEILDMLRKRKIQLTIFIDPGWAIRFPKIVNQMIYDGHEIGLFTDKKNSDITQKSILNDSNLILTNYSSNTKPLFRFGSLEITNTNIQNIEEAKYRLILWSFDVNQFTNSGNDILKQLKTASTPGSIIRFDMNKKLNIDILPEYLRYLKDKNINAVKVSSLFE